MTLPPSPEMGTPLAPFHRSEETLALLALRRSTAAAMLQEPGPGDSQIEALITLAARVPDHRRVTPYRFIIIQEQDRETIGQNLAALFAKKNPDADEAALRIEANRFLRAPVTIAVISSVNRAHKTPEWEQILTAGAVCQNLLIAASAMGFAAQWLTEWYAFDADACAMLGLGKEERVAGFILLGSAQEYPRERPRVDPQQITTRWSD